MRTRGPGTLRLVVFDLRRDDFQSPENFPFGNRRVQLRFYGHTDLMYAPKRVFFLSAELPLC
jgi:hypothetical protein